MLKSRFSFIEYLEYMFNNYCIMYSNNANQHNMSSSVSLLFHSGHSYQWVVITELPSIHYLYGVCQVLDFCNCRSRRFYSKKNFACLIIHKLEIFCY